MTQLQDNFTALASGAASAPVISATNMTGNTTGNAATATTVSANAITKDKLVAVMADAKYRHVNNSTQFTTGSGTYVEAYNCIIMQAGTYRFSFGIWTSAPGVTAVYGRLYLSHVAVLGTERTNISGTEVTYTEDIACAVGDVIQLYVKSQSTSINVYANNFKIGASDSTIICPPVELVVGAS